VKLHSCPETDCLYIEPGSGPGVETREVINGLDVDIDADGHVVGFDIDQTPARLNLTSLEARPLPLRSIRAA